MKRQRHYFYKVSHWVFPALVGLFHIYIPQTAVSQTNAVSRDSLVVEYLFSGNVKDSGKKAIHGQVHDAKLTKDRFDRSNKAYQFDGDDAIEISPPPAISTNALSISLWAKYDVYEFNEWWSNTIISQDNGDYDTGRRIIQLSTRWKLITWHKFGESNDVQAPRPLKINTWYHIVTTFDGNTHRLYIDNQLKDEQSGTMSSHVDEPLFIGRKGSDEPEMFFRGSIDDVRIYNRVLTIDEIQMLYAEQP